MTALFTIDQVAKPPGTVGRARRDIDPGIVTVECPDAHITYLWEMVGDAKDTPAVITTPEAQSTNITLVDRTGYLLGCTVDKNLPSEAISVRYIGIALEHTGLCLPALSETNQDNSQAPSFTGDRGSYDKLNDFLRQVDANTPRYASESFSQAVGAGGTERGNITWFLSEGMIYYIKASVTAGASDNTNLKFGDASFVGAPTVLYEIEDAGVPKWNPDADGDWVDRNVFGILGLTDGKLYWELINNGASSATYSVEIRAIGKV